MAEARLRSAARWTAAAAVVRAAMQLLQLVLVARLFPGEDLGVVVLLFSVIAVAQLFADLGISNLIMHHQQLSLEETRGIRGLALGSGLALAALLLVAAPLIARFYGDPRLQLLVSLASGLFLINSLWQTKRALLEKQFEFRVVGGAEILASLASQAAMVTAALLTQQLGAVLVAPLGYSVLMLIGLTLARPDIEDFRVRFSRKTLTRFGGYSAYTLGFNLSNSVSVYADIFIGGRLLTAAALGGHGVAKDLALKIGWAINPIVTRIATPLLAEHQQDRAHLRRVYAQVLRITTAMNFPVFSSLVLFAESYARLVFGAPMAAYQSSFVLLGLWGLLRSVGNPSGSLFFALGRTRLGFGFSLGSMMLFAAAAFLGALKGREALAWAMLAAMAAQQGFAIWFFIVRPLTGLGYRAYIGNLLPAAGAAALAFGGVKAALLGADAADALSWGGLIGSQLLAAMLYVALMTRFDRALAQQALQLLRREPP